MSLRQQANAVPHGEHFLKDKYGFIVGQSEAARLLRKLDWAAHALGETDAWPASLRSAVCLMVNTRIPMFILWGPAHVCLYNDAMGAALPAGRHPAALGQPGSGIWPDLWTSFGREVDAVLAGAEANWHEDQLMRVTIDGRVEERWWTWSLSPLYDERAASGVGGVMVICNDVTSQHSMTESLRAERTRLLELFQQAPGFLAVGYGEDMVFDLVNDAYLQLVGFRDLIGKPVRDALPELEGQGFFELLDQVYRSGQPFRGSALPIHLQREPDSPVELRYINFVYQPIRRADGSVIGILVEGHDVTEQQRTHDALRDAVSANQAIFDHSLDVICVFDDQGRFLDVSARASRVWGYAPQELAGRAFMDLVAPRDRARTRRAAASIMAGQPTAAFENYYLRKDGTEVPMQWSAVWEASQRRMYAVGRDLSERIKAEELLRQAQKMETIGQLTGGIAHDFNNLLTVIVGNCELLTERLASNPPQQELARMVLQAGERGAELTSRLLAFARRQALEPKILRPRDVIDGLHGLVRRALGENIELAIIHESASTAVSIDPTQFESAMLNVCINARDAMGDGGRLMIETASVVLDQDYADRHHDVEPGPYVLVAVSDTGHGMAREVLARAIDPFFTTKGLNKGTGLGLSMVYGFIKQSGGHMKIYSEPGHGTVVKLYLPVAQGELEFEPADNPAPPELRGTETILLVEDDAWVRAHASNVLRGLGYTVLEAGDGPEALTLARAHPDIALLFTDVIMPGGMNGPQLAAAMAPLLPGVPVLFTSGYTENAIVHHGRVDPGVNLLHKPYRPQKLGEKVRQALATRRSSAKE